MRKVADECGAVLMCDIAHIAGLVAGGVHPSPFPHAHVVTTTTHKTLRGPRGGMILTNDEEISVKIDRAVFPGSQGGPLMHVIAGKAVCFGEALDPSFKDYAEQIVANAQALSEALASRGYRLVSGGTDNHLLLVDLRDKVPENTGKEVAVWLESAGMITNHNGIPKDPRPPMQTSGLRLGTAAVTTRGMGSKEMGNIVDWMDQIIVSKGDSSVQDRISKEVSDFCSNFPLPH
jgi:glycine hydroxymethyltransferase